MKGMLGMNIDVSVVQTMERTTQEMIVPACFGCFTVSPLGRAGCCIGQNWR